MRKSFVFAALIASAAASSALAADADKFTGFKAEKVTELGLAGQNNATLTGLTTEAGSTGVTTQSFSGGELFAKAQSGTIVDAATVSKYSVNKSDLFAAAASANSIVSK